MQPLFFRWLQKSFYGPQIIYITIANGSFTVLYNMIFDCSKGRCNISLERKVEEQWLKFNMNRYFKDICLATKGQKRYFRLQNFIFGHKLVQTYRGYSLFHTELIDLSVISIIYLNHFYCISLLMSK